MEKLVAAVVECDKPPPIKAALLQVVFCAQTRSGDTTQAQHGKCAASRRDSSALTCMYACMPEQHIACGIPKQSDDEAITFFRICFRWRVFGPHSYRSPASDLLERFASLGPLSPAPSSPFSDPL